MFDGGSLGFDRSGFMIQDPLRQIWMKNWLNKWSIARKGYSRVHRFDKQCLISKWFSLHSYHNNPNSHLSTNSKWYKLGCIHPFSNRYFQWIGIQSVVHGKFCWHHRKGWQNWMTAKRPDEMRIWEVRERGWVKNVCSLEQLMSSRQSTDSTSRMYVSFLSFPILLSFHSKSQNGDLLHREVGRRRALSGDWKWSYPDHQAWKKIFAENRENEENVTCFVQVLYHVSRDQIWKKVNRLSKL